MTEGSRQRHIVASCFLGWTLDAFDFFILIFVMSEIAAEFGVSVKSITWALTATLGLRVLGAVIFGRIADRFGRKPALIANVLIFSLLSCASGFAPTFWAFLALRGLYGIAMGGEWGVGTALAMESIAPKWRGLVSGILQAGYPMGYLCAALLYGFGFEALGWRGMFIVSIIPAALVLYIRSVVPESPGWQAARQAKATAVSFWTVIARHRMLVLHATLLMVAAATFSHGTQDLYPTFLKVQHHLTVREVATISVIYNIGALLGSLAGGALSQAVGRRRLIVLAAGAAMLLMPVWGMSTTLVAFAATAFVMQFLVQCAFGVLPAHLNELSPAAIRGTLSGLVYQLGNMLTAANATIQATLAMHWGGNYGAALAVTAAGGAAVLCVLAWIGPENRHGDLRTGADPAPPG
jgi:SHS family lactate transporter-like MFS transporter